MKMLFFFGIDTKIQVSHQLLAFFFFLRKTNQDVFEFLLLYI